MSESNEYDLYAKMGLLGGSEFDSGLASLMTSTGLFETKWLAAGGAIAAAGAAILACVKQASAFEDSMANVKTVIGPGQETLFSQMQEDILSMSTELPISANELAKTLYDITSYGVPAADAINVLRISGEAAVGGFTDVNSTFTLFASIIKGYGLEWSEVQNISDKMFLVASQGATTIEQLSSSIGGSIPFAKKLGVSLDEVYAVMATLPGVTGTTAQAATQLESVMVSLLNPTDGMQVALGKLGVASGEDLIEKMGGLQEALKALNEYAEKNNVAVGDMLGRKEGQLAFYNLVGSQADEYATKLKNMADAAGVAKAAFDIKIVTTENQWTILGNSISTLAINIGNMLLPATKILIEGFKDLSSALGFLADGFKVVDQFITGWTGKYFENANIELTKLSNTLKTLWFDIKQFFGANETMQEKQQRLVSEAMDEEAKAFQNLTAWVEPATKSLKDNAEAHKNVTDNARKTVELTKEQIAKNKELAKYWEDVSGNHKQAWAEINHDLYLESQGLNEIVYAIGGGSNSIVSMMGMWQDKSNEVGREVLGYKNITKELANIHLVEVKRQTELIKAATEAARIQAEIKAGRWRETAELINNITNTDLGSKIADWAKRTENFKGGWKDVVGLVGEIASDLPGIGKAGQDVIGILTSFAVGGFDPITLGLQGLNLALDVFGIGGEKVKLTVDQVKDSMGALGDEIEYTSDAYDRLNSQFQSSKIDTLKTQQSVLLEMITGLKNSLGDKYGEKEITRLQGLLAGVTSELNDYLYVFEQKETMGEVTENLEYLVTQGQDLRDTFGDIDNSKFNNLLQEAIANAENFKNSLDPTSKAFAEIEEKLKAANDFFNEINGKTITVNVDVNVPDLGDLLPDYTLPTNPQVKDIEKYASGGYIERDKIAMLHAGEVVLRPEVTREVGAGNLLNLNRTGDPSALGGTGASRPFNVTIYNANPDTYAQISDRIIEPRINYRTRKMQVAANPYA
jgi:TP901 family phage tail tape measure protein